MIQRIQTLYLFLSLVCAVLLFFLPVWQGAISEGSMNEIGGGTHPFLMVVAGLLVVFHLVTIFSFKNRKRQKQLCTGNILLYFIFLLLALLVIQLESQFFQHVNMMEFRLGMLLPEAGVVLNVLARRSISQDEALVRSMDRLR